MLQLGGGGGFCVRIYGVEAFLVRQVLVQIGHRADGLYNRMQRRVLP